MIAVVSPSRTSTSGRASVGMKPCTKALYVSLISRCDSAAMVPNTSEDLPDPETPVNTVSRRFGISMLTFLRLFSRAPWTRMRSWLSAGCRVEEAMIAVPGLRAPRTVRLRVPLLRNCDLRLGPGRGALQVGPDARVGRRERVDDRHVARVAHRHVE